MGIIGPGVDPVPKKKVTVTFEQFQKVTRALVMHLRQHEDATQDGGFSSLIYAYYVLKTCADFELEAAMTEPTLGCFALVQCLINH